MTTITIDSALLEQVQEFLYRVTHWKGGNHEELTDLHDMKETIKAALAAPATAPAQPEIVDLLAEMYELILANKVVLAEKSGGVWTWPDRAIEAVRKHRSGPAQPERTPMTKEQREQVARRAEAAMNGNVNLSWRDALISETEAFHDIKETP
jgi:hypothetical protein